MHLVHQHTLIMYLLYLRSVHGYIEGHVVGGDYVDIEQYPHSALLQIQCYNDYAVDAYRCGASILNQEFGLTAAHCFHSCNPRRSHTAVIVGHEHSKQGLKSSASSFKIHEKYEHPAMRADIAIVQLKTPLKLNAKVQRVALGKPGEYPINKVVVGYVAGWGLINDEKLGTERLKQCRQPVWTRANCTKLLNGKLPEGTFCAGYLNGKMYAAQGDSGSALIIQNYIQIGLVSYKNPAKSKSIIIYTDVSYFYDWIKVHTKNMYCNNQI